MTHTVRFCHLEHKPTLNIGDVVKRGDIVGRMGNTGQSSGAHLHIDCVEGMHSMVWRLGQMEANVITPSIRQLNYFIDDELFNTPHEITTYYGCPDYMKLYNKVHCAYDVVPKNRDRNYFDIFWNRSKHGTITAIGYDDIGYGWYINISFEG